MSGDSIFSPRLLIAWIAAAVIVFVLSLYFMGGGQVGAPESVGPSTFSRSAIGHEGIAEVLTQLGISVVKSQSSSLDKLSPGSVLVIAEPRHNAQAESAIRTLLQADTILLVLPKWTGQPSEHKEGWLEDIVQRPLADAQWMLDLTGIKGQVTRQSSDVAWTDNAFKLTPNLDQPIQLMTVTGLRPIIASDHGTLLGESIDPKSKRKIWILSDPDVIANRGLAHPDNAALAVAVIDSLRSGDGRVVFDETVHGFVVQTASPLLLLFRFPFVVATLQGLVAIAVLLWATLGRFGAPQSAPPPLRTGREGLLENSAKLVEAAGHQDVIIRRYVRETINEVARQLHAPRTLSGEALLTWLQRVGKARGVEIDCTAVVLGIGDSEGARRNLSPLVRLARDIHQWKGDIVDGRSRDPRPH